MFDELHKLLRTELEISLENNSKESSEYKIW